MVSANGLAHGVWVTVVQHIRCAGRQVHREARLAEALYSLTGCWCDFLAAQTSWRTSRRASRSSCPTTRRSTRRSPSTAWTCRACCSSRACASRSSTTTSCPLPSRWNPEPVLLRRSPLHGPCVGGRAAARLHHGERVCRCLGNEQYDGAPPSCNGAGSLLPTMWRPCARPPRVLLTAAGLPPGAGTRRCCQGGLLG